LAANFFGNRSEIAQERKLLMSFMEKKALWENLDCRFSQAFEKEEIGILSQKSPKASKTWNFFLTIENSQSEFANYIGRITSRLGLPNYNLPKFGILALSADFFSTALVPEFKDQFPQNLTASQSNSIQTKCWVF